MATTKIRGNTQIMADTITNAEISASAAIALSKLAEAVIQADGGQAFTADQSMGGFKLTSLGTPTADTDAATKAYVDSVAQGLSPKEAVRAATTAAGTLATSFENGDTVDGVVLVTGDRILIKNQAAPAENGIYTVNASGAPTRATDANTADKIGSAFTFVSEGTANADIGYVLTTDAPITLNTTGLTFTQFSGAGDIVGGAGIVKTGNTLDVVGTANRIVVSADAVDIGTDVVTLNASQTLTTKTIALGSNTVSGTKAQFDTAVTDGNFLYVGDVTQYTDEMAQDAVGAMVDGSLTYVDGTPLLQRAALTGHVTASAGSNALVLGSFTKAQLDTAVSDGNVLYVGDITQGYVEANFVTRETPSGAVNGANTAYTLANTPIAGSEEVFLNGILQEPGAGNDYTISGTAITYLTAPVTGDKLRVNYRK